MSTLRPCVTPGAIRLADCATPYPPKPMSPLSSFGMSSTWPRQVLQGFYGHQIGRWPWAPAVGTLSWLLLEVTPQEAGTRTMSASLKITVRVR